jgi:AraC-like DNA-binding protein
MEDDILKKPLEAFVEGLSRNPPAFLYPTGGDSGVDELDTIPATVCPSDSHIDTEMLMLLEGRAVLLGTRRNYELMKGRTIVIAPGTPHAESYYSKDESYKILWISVRPNGLLLLISAYNRGDINFQTTLCETFVETKFSKELWILCSKIRGEALELSDQLRVQAYALLSVCDVMESYEKGETLSRKEYSKSIVNQISAYIKHNYANEFSIKDLAKLARLSPNYLNSLFKKETGKPLYALILETRLEQAAKLLRTTNMPVKGVAVSSGFSDPLYFCRIFKKKYNLNPSNYRLSKHRN